MKRSELGRTPFARNPVFPAVKPRPRLPWQSSRARAQRAPRAAAEAVLGRVGGLGVCARCLRTTNVNGHERLGRAQGGDPAKPDCLLCVLCNTWCEDWPVEAAFDGWKISRKHDRDPLLAPDQARDAHGGIHQFRRAA